MKSLILAFVLFIIALSSPGNGAKTQKNPNGQQHNPDSSPQLSAVPGASQARGIDKPDAKQYAYNRDKKSDNIWQKAVAPETWPNWLLAIVGILGVYVAVHTLKAIEEQVNAVVLSERAWLVMRPDSFTLQPSGKLDWAVTNTGRTVARILEAGIRCGIYDVVSNRLPDMPNYGVPVNLYRVPICPGDSLKLWSNIETPPKRVFQGTGLTAEDIDDIKTKGNDLVAYGVVKYLDSFGNSRESRFCYYYAFAFGEFRIYLLAPAEYHKCE
jgi:hypothetical protein